MPESRKGMQNPVAIIGVRCAPWKHGERGVVSLEDLLGYAADVFCAMSDIAGRIIGISTFNIVGVLKTDSFMQELYRRLEAVKKQCIEHGWRETASRIAEVVNYLNGGSGPIIPAVAQAKMADLQSHFHRLLEEELFFHVAKGKSADYFEWCEGTSVWRNSFPYSYVELCSAAECYLFGKSVASVFHSMRALEIALQATAKELSVPFEREQWENLINNIEVQIKKINGPHAGADWKKKQEIYSEVALHFRYLKNAWRNHVMHVRHNYNDKAAKQIWQHASDFVSELAVQVKLKEFKNASLASLLAVSQQHTL